MPRSSLACQLLDDDAVNVHAWPPLFPQLHKRTQVLISKSEGFEPPTSRSELNALTTWHLSLPVRTISNESLYYSHLVLVYHMLFLKPHCYKKKNSLDSAETRRTLSWISPLSCTTPLGGRACSRTGRKINRKLDSKNYARNVKRLYPLPWGSYPRQKL